MSSPAVDSLTAALILSTVVWLVRISEGSVHDYTGDKFIRKGNAFVLHGGTEEIYSSRPNHSSSPSANANGDSFIRYAYSEDASEEFDKDDTLTLIKPSPMPSVDARSPEVRQVHAGNGLSNGDSEEDKTVISDMFNIIKLCGLNGHC